MHNRIKETFDSIHAEEALKTTTKAFLTDQTNHYRSKKASCAWRMLPILACFLFLLIGLGGHRLYFTKTSIISIDINPSLELYVNRFDKVISVRSYNDDGQKLAKHLDVQFMDYPRAIEQILQTKRITACLDADELLFISVTGQNEQKNDEMLAAIETCMHGKNHVCRSAGNFDEAKKAHEAGLSVGKYRAFLELQNVRPDITAEEVKGLCMRQIQELIERPTEDVPSGSDAACNGTGHSHGHGHGADNCRSQASDEALSKKPQIKEMDWSDYFGGLNGAAVIYDASNEQYLIYNKDLATTRRSPCSTFKIISSLIALEHGVLVPEASTRTWSKETFWNENWNRDTDFYQAFRDSCVWYFRELIDETGKDAIQKELDRLSYGNCDISDWEGRQNTNNSNRALTGFWIESSLLISPKEQAEVMERIFGDDSVYSGQTLDALKQAMLVTESNAAAFLIYGKTGMGKANGVLVDAWFTGFSESADGNLCFCVYLGKSDEEAASSATAKEIAIRILSDLNAQIPR